MIIVLIGLLLAISYADRLTYDDGTIGGFEYTISNPDYNTGASYVMDESEFSQQTDDDLTTGYTLAYPDNDYRTWGSSSANPIIGMKGEFYAVDLNPGQGNAFYQITTAEITFVAESCFGDDATATFTYVNTQGTTVVNTIDVTMTALSTPTGGFTFAADLPYGGIQVDNDGPIGFNIQSNQYCEGTYAVTEFLLEGTAVATSEPSQSPTKKPTESPTTAEPTMSPTSSCIGEVTWGDPHYQLMAADSSVSQFNYQELGWFYYIAPCDLSNFEDWPFFLLSYHTQCFWQGNPKGCINNNMLVLNTKPNPWVITFTDDGFSIEYGSGINSNANYDTSTYYTSSNPLEINYDDEQDDPNQSGQLKIFYENGQIVLQLYYVKYEKSPRPNGPYASYQQTIDIRNSGTWTVYNCPRIFRNIACGLMGKFYRGDCSKDDMKDSNNKCSQVLVKSDGGYARDSRGRAYGDDTFEEMANTWKEDYVTDVLSNSYSYTVNFASKRSNKVFKHQKTKKEMAAFNGRNLDIDASRLDGYCQNDAAKVAQVNETCRLNTVVKYAKCCKEIGICEQLWGACIEDLCSCSTPDAPNNITDEWCLNKIVHDSMNTTCSVPWLYPTATPTNAPTPSPTGLIGSLPTSTKAKDLIWLYLIFVVLFIIIAGGAYWYYRKKNNSGKAGFDDDIEAPQEATTGNTYAQD